MTTATATKPRSALAGLELLELAYAKAKSEADELGRQLHAQSTQQPDLINERRRLYHRDPTLFDHLERPAAPDNAVAAVDARIDELGDLADLGARVAHARRVTENCRQSATEFSRENLTELKRDFQAPAAAVATAANDGIAAAVEDLRRYLGVQQRFASIIGAAGEDNRCVPGLDQVAALIRQLENLRLPDPAPEVTDG